MGAFGIGEAVGEAVGVAVGVAEGVGVGVAVGVGTGIGVGFFTATPLFHTNFFPDFMQVYLKPEVVLVCPNFLQMVPGFTEAIAFG